MDQAGPALVVETAVSSISHHNSIAIPKRIGIIERQNPTKVVIEYFSIFLGLLYTTTNGRICVHELFEVDQVKAMSLPSMKSVLNMFGNLSCGNPNAT